MPHIVRELKEEILISRNLTGGILYKMMAQRLGCALNTIANKFTHHCQFYPIPIIQELLALSKQRKRFKQEILAHIDYLKVNSASAKPIKAIYALTSELAQIIGAFMADGSLNVQSVFETTTENNLKTILSVLQQSKIKYSHGRLNSRNRFYASIQINKKNSSILRKLIPAHLSIYANQTHYSIELSDEYKNNVDVFNTWMKNVFEAEPSSFQKRKRNAWRTIFSNKTIARCFMSFFDITPGPKTYTAHEPENIKISSLKTRKAFTKGILMFDGCVTKHSKVILSVKSYNLFASVKDVWERDHIKFGTSHNKRNEWILFSTAQNKREKLLKYFDKNTQKHKLLRWLSGDRHAKPLIKDKPGISTKKILKILSSIKSCDAEFLQKHFECTHTTARLYLKILKAQNKIKLSHHPYYISSHISEKVSVFLEKSFHKKLFDEIKTRFSKYKNCAAFLGVKRATFSAWHTQKNRIPIGILKQLSQLTKFDSNEIFKNIIQTDREIAEVIQ